MTCWLAGPPAMAGSSFPGVLPRPKEYRELGPPTLLAPAGTTIRVHILGEEPVMQTAARDLAARIEALGAEVSDDATHPQILVGVAGTHEALERFDKPASVPDHPQAYALSVRADEQGTSATVVVVGRDALGAYYGVQTLVQLLARDDRGITVRRAEIRDWPTFTFRSFKGQCWYYRDNRMFPKWAPRFKWNVFGPCYGDCPKWRDPPGAYRNMIADVCDTATRTRAIRIMQLGNPYMLKAEAIRASSAQDVDTLARFFELSLDRGSDVLMLCLDDFAYLPDEDAKRFGTLAAANADVVTRFAKRIWSRHPGVRILLCPPPYWLPKKERERQYLRDLSASIPPQIKIVWTGKVVTTVRHEAVDIEAYQALLGPDRGLFLWDNTLKMPPGWSNVFRANPFLADCDDIAGSAWPQMARFTGGEAVINTYGPAELYKIPLMTAADYLWNPESYDPDDALARALYWFDDNPDVGPMVHRFANDVHQRLYDRRLAFLAKPSFAGLRDLTDLTGQLQRGFDAISAATDNRMLVATLRPYLQRHVDALPIMTLVLTAYARAGTDADASRRAYDEASAALDELTRTLERGDITIDRHGCVRQRLEKQTAGAIAKLRERVQ